MGKSESDWPMFELARSHYRACSDMDARNTAGIEPMMRILNIIGKDSFLSNESFVIPKVF